MQALCWHGKGDIRCDTVPDPTIEDARDVIVKVSSCAICGSDLHLMDGQMPAMESGDVLGHEFMGEVVEVGSPDHPLKKGGRVRVPMADVAPMKVPEGMTDEQILFLSDILPTGWQGADHCEITGGDIIAVWGAGPVGLFAIKSAVIMGAERVVAIESVPERIARARKAGATDVIDFTQEDVLERIKEISKGQGADAVIDCVGMKAHGSHGLLGVLSAVQETLTSMQRPYALEQMIQAVRPSGIVSVPGVYAGPVPVNMAAVVQKGLTIKSGQTHVKRYLEPLTKLIQDGTIDPAFLITHRSKDLADGPDLYKAFRDKQDGCVKVVFNLS